MTRQIELPGSNDRGDNKFEKAVDTGSQKDYYVGNKETGAHCHMWKNTDTGESGVVHRDECGVCDDEE